MAGESEYVPGLIRPRIFTSQGLAAKPSRRPVWHRKIPGRTSRDLMMIGQSVANGAARSLNPEVVTWLSPRIA